MTYDVIIIGGGPAGLMAANQLEKTNINYVLLEKNEQVGKKVLLTGGKRCNVTNNLSVRDFIDTLTIQNKKFIYPALKQFGPQEILAFFKENGLELILENNFKYFPETGKSSDVLEVLTHTIHKDHIKFGQSVKKIEKLEDYYEITTNHTVFHGRFVIVATGSNSYPQVGSSGDGLKFAEHLGIPYKSFTPAETSIYSKQVVDDFKSLRGTSLTQTHVSIKGTKIAYVGDLLFTHVGLSGPVIMHLSEFIYEDIVENGKSTITFGFINKTEEELYNILIENKNKLLHKVLEDYTSKRIVEVVLALKNIVSIKIAEMKKKDLMYICNFFTKYEFVIDSVEDYKRAYVNKGGIDLKVLDPKSMEVKTHPNLYFIGETTDLHGPIGGYNITIALSTGYLASHDIIDKIKQ